MHMLYYHIRHFCAIGAQAFGTLSMQCILTNMSYGRLMGRRIILLSRLAAFRLIVE